MKNSFAVGLLALGCASLMTGQLGRTTDWWSYGGDAQRDGWEKSEGKFTKEEVKNFQLLWQRKLDNSRSGPRAITPPVILGNLIGYRGFKELAFLVGSSGKLWSIDVDLNRMYFEKQFGPADSKGGKKAGLTACSTEEPSMPSLAPPVTFRPRKPSTTARPNGTVGATPAPRPPDAFRRFMTPQPVYLISGDGMLHKLNQEDGSEMMAPTKFLPPGAPAQNTNVAEDVVYTSTAEACGGASAIWALDLSGESPKVNSFAVGGAEVKGLGGVTLGIDGTVFAQTGDGESDPANGKYGNTLLALAPGELKLENYFQLPGAGASKKDFDTNVTSPVVFAFKGKDMIVTAGKDGRLYLLDAETLGGADHHTFLAQSAPLTSADGNSADHGIWGSLSSWEDPDGTRYVLAAVWGGLHPDFKAPTTNGETTHGAVVAFTVQEQDGKLALAPAWVSRDLNTPAPPVIAQGVVFALSNGDFKAKIKTSHGTSMVEQHAESGTHATLYALDGATGKELYSTGDQIKAAGNLTGLTIANGRVYFVTADNMLNAVGKYLEH